ncbi:hypothetical protein [Streptomyces sp. NPDC088261]|uniref:hypothetical protein n=1 Tax=Streptomyces sp. NPDC088261 TaxID=3365851 RepID=UPI0037FC3E11
MSYDIPDICISAYRRRLAEAGIEVTEAQVRAVDEWAEKWDRGRMTLVELCTRTGWPLPPGAAGEPGEIMRYYAGKALGHVRAQRPEDPVDRVRAVAEDVASVRGHLLPALDDELRDALAAADQAARDEEGALPRGHRERLVRAAERGVSRAGVFKALAVGETYTAAQRALRPIWQSLPDGFSLLLLGNAVILRCHPQGQLADFAFAHNNAVDVLNCLGDAGFQFLSVSGGTEDSFAAQLASGVDITLARSTAAAS